MKLTTTKKTKKVTEEEKPTFNKYGVCIACQGGSEECFHQNLIEENGVIACKMCGLIM